MDFSSFSPAATQYDGNNAYCLGQAASLAYKGEAEVRDATAACGFSQFRFFDSRDTQAFMTANANTVIVAFRGTQPADLKDWMTDADIVLVKGPYGLVHAGFQRGLTAVWPAIADTLLSFQGAGKTVWFTGHSLGAALATLAVATLRAPPSGKAVQGLYTFGSPRVGDRTFEQGFDADCKGSCFRYVNNADVVTRVPLRAAGYTHVGTFLYFDKDGTLHNDISFWDKFVDSVRANVEGLDKLSPEALAAHSMDRYLANLKKNVGTKLS